MAQYSVPGKQTASYHMHCYNLSVYFFSANGFECFDKFHLAKGIICTF